MIPLPAMNGRDFEPILSCYGLEGADAYPVASGLINRSFRVERQGLRWFLQQVNPIFGPEVHHDIEAVTAHLEAKGLLTPRLVRTRGGKLWTTAADGSVWRLFTFIEGATYHHTNDHELCHAAGQLVGRFHPAVQSLAHQFQHTRVGVHATAQHLDHLEDVLKTHQDHPAHGKLWRVAEEILRRARRQPSLEDLPTRVVHGDLKLSNILFSGSGEALALVDLDTFGQMPIPVELGDALRSWCNPSKEDVLACHFELPLCEAALGGYAEQGAAILTDKEREAIPTAIETITLELAARFAADTLEESYFGWDEDTHEAAWQHNLKRAKAQLALASSIGDQRRELSLLVSGVLGA